MDTRGILVSLFASGAVMLCSAYIFTPATMTAQTLADRLALGALPSLVVGRAWSVGLSDLASLDAPMRGFAGDGEYWLVIVMIAGVVAWVSTPARRRAQAAGRCVDAAPCVLAGYGSYQALCGLRRICLGPGAGIESSATVPVEALLGVALIGLAVVLRYLWALEPNARLSLVVAALALDRVVLRSASTGGLVQWRSMISIVVLTAAALATMLYVARSARLSRRRHEAQRSGLDSTDGGRS